MYLFFAVLSYVFGISFLISSFFIKKYPDSAKALESYPRYKEWQVWYTFIGSFLLFAVGTAFLLYEKINPTATTYGFMVSILFLIGGATAKRQKEDVDENNYSRDDTK